MLSHVDLNHTAANLHAARFVCAVLIFVVSGSVVAEETPPAPVGNECVVLLHGLARTARSMTKMEEALVQEGYRVVNVDYPSREKRVEELSGTVIPDAIADCGFEKVTKVHFVTHSLGGILVRHYFAQTTVPKLGRVVMLSPPNQGSEVVDELGNVPGFELINGPAGQQLGTGDASIPAQLPPVDYAVGVITGDKTINFYLSTLIPGKDDGKVSVERAQVAGMADFLVVHHSHPFIMRADDVINQTIYFLGNGHFDHSQSNIE